MTGRRHEELDALVRPFVFRKYLDFDAYDGLRDIHRQIGEQGRRNDYAQNIKLGPGGIREIEFIVQALQIVRGGREPALRARGTLPALAAAAERGLLPPRPSMRCATRTCTCAISSTVCSIATTGRRRRCPPRPRNARRSRRPWAAPA
jgi:glutamine synthetase adenylyltransferase